MFEIKDKVSPQKMSRIITNQIPKHLFVFEHVRSGWLLLINNSLHSRYSTQASQKKSFTQKKF